MHFGEKTRKKSPACRASCKKVETGARVRCSTSSRIYDPTSPSVVHQQRICKWENVLVFCLAVESVRCETPCRIGRRLWLDNVESIQPLASNQGQFIHGEVNIQKWFKRSNALVETPLFFFFFLQWCCTVVGLARAQFISLPKSASNARLRGWRTAR